MTPGTRLGVYEVTALIGEGGMRQAFRGRDTKLNRDVALKVLPDSFANDADRLARFTCEAQTLASLNHTHIAAIYGLEESGGVRALVMEPYGETSGGTPACLRSRGGECSEDPAIIARLGSSIQHAAQRLKETIVARSGWFVEADCKPDRSGL